MKVLLDTHAFLWAITADERLPESARKAFEQHELFLSVASIWEIVIKVQLGKLPLPGKLGVYVPSQIARNGIFRSAHSRPARPAFGGKCIIAIRSIEF